MAAGLKTIGDIRRECGLPMRESGYPGPKSRGGKELCTLADRLEKSIAAMEAIQPMLEKIAASLG
jgi:hypothetical protein